MVFSIDEVKTIFAAFFPADYSTSIKTLTKSSLKPETVGALMNMNRMGLSSPQSVDHYIDFCCGFFFL